MEVQEKSSVQVDWLAGDAKVSSAKRHQGHGPSAQVRQPSSLAIAAAPGVEFLAGGIVKTYFDGVSSVVPRDLAPQFIILNIQSSNSDPNASAQQYRNLPEVQKVVVELDKKGKLTFESDLAAIGMANPKEVAARFVIGHELGHTVYEKTMKKHGQESIDNLMKSVMPHANKSDSFAAASMMHGDPWCNTVVNESFADAMGLIYLAKTSTKSEFDKAARLIQTAREVDSHAPLSALDKGASKPGVKFDRSNIDIHLTGETDSIAAAFGYERLRSLDPKSAPAYALDAAHRGFLSMMGKHRAAFEKIGVTPNNDARLPALLDAGATVSVSTYAADRNSGSTTPKLDASDLAKWRKSRESQSVPSADTSTVPLSSSRIITL